MCVLAVCFPFGCSSPNEDGVWFPCLCGVSRPGMYRWKMPVVVGVDLYGIQGMETWNPLLCFLSSIGSTDILIMFRGTSLVYRCYIPEF